MVRTAHRACVAAFAAGQELVGAVAADVEEAAQRPVVAAHQEDAVAPGDDRALIAGPEEVARRSRADPRALEEALALPGEDRLGRVRLRGQQAAPAEGEEDFFERGAVEGSGSRGHAGL